MIQARTQPFLSSEGKGVGMTRRKFRRRLSVQNFGNRLRQPDFMSASSGTFVQVECHGPHHCESKLFTDQGNVDKKAAQHFLAHDSSEGVAPRQSSSN